MRREPRGEKRKLRRVTRQCREMSRRPSSGDAFRIKTSLAVSLYPRTLGPLDCDLSAATHSLASAAALAPVRSAPASDGCKHETVLVKNPSS